MTMVAQRPDAATLLAQSAEAERAGDLARALALGMAATAADPYMPAAWFVVGVAQHRLGQAAEAVASLERARDLAPGQPSILHTLGLVAFAAKRFEVAIAALRELADDPGDLTANTLAEALALLAMMLSDVGRPAEGEPYARSALARAPENQNARIALAACLFKLNRPGEARDTVGSNLEDVPTLLLLASAFEGQRQPERALPLYTRVLQLEPDNHRARLRQLDVQLTLCDWQNYDALVGGVLDRVRADIAAGEGLSFDVFNLLPLPVDPPLILAASRAQAAKHAAGVQPLAHPPRAETGRRIRIGYLLPYTERHSLPQALIGVIERHDRARFEVLGYSLRVCDGSPFSLEFRGKFDAMRDLVPGQCASSAKVVRDDDLDILIDTTGHTGLNALGILAHRPAPLQAHYLGYGLTSGASYVDYLVTDRRFLGPGGEAFVSEAPVFLPHSFMATMRAPIAMQGPSRAEEGLPEKGVVFANFNHPCKIDPTTFALWMALLRAEPGSVLWLGDWADGTRSRLRGVAATQGVSPKRLVFAKLAPHPIHLKRLELADLGLDNRLHGGGVTTVDALWAGLPVVSLAGRTPAARLGATLLPAAGVPELVTESAEDYATLALTLARDPARRTALRARLLAGRDTAPLFDAARQTRDLEAAYAAMHARRAGGLAPAAIDVAELAG